MLILLGATCLAWIGILSLAFMSFMGTDVTAGWIFAGVLFVALVVWIMVMAGEFRSAMETPRGDMEEDDSNEAITSPLPRSTMFGQSSGFDRIAWQGRRFLPVAVRPTPRRIARAERPANR